jgi:coproporphyrinogen III oxidase-like Fe-S oxidoreductase
MLLTCQIVPFLAFAIAIVTCTVTSFISSSAGSNKHNCALLGNNDALEYPKEEVSLSSPQTFGLYIHIPYCRRRCRYCNFAIVPIGTSVETDVHSQLATHSPSMGFHRMNQRYTAALLKELHSIQQNSLERNICLQSIYFGGGTPSLMPTESLRQIITAISDQNVFHVERNTCEITMEVDPGTFTTEKLREWKDLGVNRLSLGVQSFDDKLLESLGRVHRSKDIYDAVALIHAVYGDDVNYSIDLISGLPGLSLALWMETLQIATTRLHPRPKHLSVYDLQIEEVLKISGICNSFRNCSYHLFVLVLLGYRLWKAIWKDRQYR